MANKTKAKRLTWGQMTTKQRAGARRRVRAIAADLRHLAKSPGWTPKRRADLQGQADALLAAVEKLMSPSD